HAPHAPVPAVPKPLSSPVAAAAIDWRGTVIVARRIMGAAGGGGADNCASRKAPDHTGGDSATIVSSFRGLRGSGGCDDNGHGRSQSGQCLGLRHGAPSFDWGCQKLVIINRRTGPASLCCQSQKGEFFRSSLRFENRRGPLLMSAKGQKRTLAAAHGTSARYYQRRSAAQLTASNRQSFKFRL